MISLDDVLTGVLKKKRETNFIPKRKIFCYVHFEETSFQEIVLRTKSTKSARQTKHCGSLQNDTLSSRHQRAKQAACRTQAQGRACQGSLLPPHKHTMQRMASGKWSGAGVNGTGKTAKTHLDSDGGDSIEDEDASCMAASAPRAKILKFSSSVHSAMRASAVAMSGVHASCSAAVVPPKMIAFKAAVSSAGPGGGHLRTMRLHTICHSVQCSMGRGVKAAAAHRAAIRLASLSACRIMAPAHACACLPTRATISAACKMRRGSSTTALVSVSQQVSLSALYMK